MIKFALFLCLHLFSGFDFSVIVVFDVDVVFFAFVPVAACFRCLHLSVSEYDVCLSVRTSFQLLQHLALVGHCRKYSKYFKSGFLECLSFRDFYGSWFKTSARSLNSDRKAVLGFFKESERWWRIQRWRSFSFCLFVSVNLQTTLRAEETSL